MKTRQWQAKKDATTEESKATAEELVQSQKGAHRPSRQIAYDLGGFQSSVQGVIKGLTLKAYKRSPVSRRDQNLRHVERYILDPYDYVITTQLKTCSIKCVFTILLSSFVVFDL